MNEASIWGIMVTGIIAIYLRYGLPLILKTGSR
jgi:hypothetical protein